MEISDVVLELKPGHAYVLELSEEIYPASYETVQRIRDDIAVFAEQAGCKIIILFKGATIREIQDIEAFGHVPI